MIEQFLMGVASDHFEAGRCMGREILPDMGDSCQRQLQSFFRDSSRAQGFFQSVPGGELAVRTMTVKQKVAPRIQGKDGCLARVVMFGDRAHFHIVGQYETFKPELFA